MTSNEVRIGHNFLFRKWRYVTVGAIVVAIVVGVIFETNGSAKTSALGPLSKSPPKTTSEVRPQELILNRPEALALTGKGNVLISNDGSNQILLWTRKGGLSVLAGTGKQGYSGDNGPANKAELSDPGGIAVASDGTIYVADTGNNRVRAISPSGTINTVAGNGNPENSAAGRSAVDVGVDQPVAVAVTKKGELYVADGAGLQTISPNGAIATVMASGPGVLKLHGTRIAFNPDAVAIGPSGNLFVANFSPKVLIELSPAGQVIKSWDLYVSPAGLATSPTGSVLVADYGQFALDKIAGNHLTKLVKFRATSLSGIGGVFRPYGVAVNMAGQIYADTNGTNGGTNVPVFVTIGAKGATTILIR